MDADNIYDGLEDSIVAALQPLASDRVEIGLVPDREIEASRTVDKSRVYVMFHTGLDDNQLSTIASLNEEPVIFQLIYESRSRRGPAGSTGLKVRVAELLGGLKVPGFKPLTLGKFEFHDKKQGGVWQYNQLIKTTAIQQQKNYTAEPGDELPPSA